VVTNEQGVALILGYMIKHMDGRAYDQSRASLLLDSYSTARFRQAEAVRYSERREQEEPRSHASHGRRT
jgi:hypothetical protein